MLAINFCLSIFLIVITGYFIFPLFIKKKENFSFIEVIALSFGLGNGVISFWMFLISLLRMHFTFVSLLAPTSIVGIIYYLYVLRKKKQYVYNYKTLNFSKISFFEMVIIGLIAVNVIFVLLKASVLPFIQWDSWCNWGFKARLFYNEGFVSGKIFQDFAVNIPRSDQPLNLYLLTFS